MLQICIAFTKGSPSLWPPLHHWSLVLTAPVLVPVSSGENRWFKSSFSNSYSFSTFLYATVAFFSITLDTKLGCSNNINPVCESVRLHDSRSLNENITWWYSDMCTILVNLSVKQTPWSQRSHCLATTWYKLTSVCRYSHTSRCEHAILFIFYFIFCVRLCRFCVVIRFFHSRHNGQWPPTSKAFLYQMYSVFSSPPQRPMTSDFEGLSIPDFIHYIYFSWERVSIFPFECSVLNKGTTGTIFCNVFDMTRSLTRDWTRDLPRSKPALYH